MSDLSPRQWGNGDPEPADRPMVRDRHGDVWTAHPTGVWETPETMPCSWEYIARKFHPLTEVLPEKATRCDSQTSWHGNHNIKYCVYPEGHEMPHRSGEVGENGTIVWWDEDEEPVPPASSPQDGSISPSVGGGDGETVTDELRAKLAGMIYDGLDIAMRERGRTPVHIYDDARAVAERLLSDGWRPPQTPCDCLPFNDCSKCATQVDLREVAIRQLAYCETSIQVGVEPDDGAQCPNLREHRSVHCAEHRTEQS